MADPPATREPFYLSSVTQPCPYLPGREATLAFCNGHLAAEQYRDLLDLGYRRNGVYLYQPVCPSCAACEVLRVPVATFQASRGQRRVWKRCHGRFGVRTVRPAHSPEREDLYHRYLEGHHQDPDAEDNATHYRSFLVDSCLGDHTFEVQYRFEGGLVGLGIVDQVGDALSSVYFFFDPKFARFSLGTYSALLEIDLARRWGLGYYYLGYHVAGCPKMRYKATFRPCEVRRRHADTWETPAAPPSFSGVTDDNEST